MNQPKPNAKSEVKDEIVDITDFREIMLTAEEVPDNVKVGIRHDLIGNKLNLI
jgi:hypothetical protein